MLNFFDQPSIRPEDFRVSAGKGSHDFNWLQVFQGVACRLRDVLRIRAEHESAGPDGTNRLA
jgi:hypothetical protein